MAQKTILFVEDNAAAQRAFDKAVRHWNRESEDVGRSFEVVLRESFAEAKTALDSASFDCALFDLHIPSSRQEDDAERDTKGNELAEISLTENSLPVAIISALPGDKDPRLDRFAMLKVFGKAERSVYRKAVAWLGDQWELMDAVSATRKKIRETGAEVFVNYVWPRFAAWQETKGVDGEELTRIVTRQYASHIAELLGVADGGGPKWHPFETYVMPAMQPIPHTGDLYTLKGELWVVLTPPCDMAQCNVDDVMLAYCDRSPIEGWDTNLERLRNAQDPNQRERGARYFRDKVNQNIDLSCHFLPPLDDERPIMVRFRKLIVKSRKELAESTRLASVSPHFLPNLTQRFGAYMSRTGQPDLDVHYFS